jgi:hypothetical protein
MGLGLKVIILGMFAFVGMTHAKNSRSTTPDSRLLNSLKKKWIQPAWVKTPEGMSGRRLSSDADGNGGADENGNSKNGMNDGAMNGDGAGDNQQLTNQDQNGKKDGGNGVKDEVDKNRGGKSTPPPMSSGNGTVAFGKWYPMCIFIDPSIKNGNELVKGQVDNAAKCGVNLAVWAITVKSDYPPNADTINSLQKASCNLKDLLGVKQWSTQVANKYMETPAMMCNAKKGDPPHWDLDVAGCAQLCSKGGVSDKFLSGQKAGGYGQGIASDGAVPDILQPNASADVGTHEAIGHSQMCWPNYDKLEGQRDVGLGIGTPPKGSTARLDMILDSLYALAKMERPQIAIVGAAEGGSLGSSFNGEGCAQFRANAYDNDGTWRYDPQQSYYYVPEPEPERQWKLGEPLFGKSGQAPPDPPPSFQHDPRPDPTELTMVDTAKVDNAGKAKPDDIIEDPSHRKKKLSDVLSEARDALTKSLTETLRKGRSFIPDAIDKTQGGVPQPDKAGDNDPTQLTFDDQAKQPPSDDEAGRGKRSGNVYGGASTSVSVGGGGGDDGNQLYFDESAAKGEYSGGGGGSGSRNESAGTRSPSSMGGGFEGLDANSSASGTASGNMESSDFMSGGTTSAPALPEDKRRVRGSGLRPRGDSNSVRKNSDARRGARRN